MKTQVLPSWYATNTHNHQGVVACEKTGRTVAVTYDKADAHLIAAAPELLGALKAMLDSGCYDDAGNFVISCESWDGQGDPPDSTDPLCVQSAWTAIAKAEGRG